MNATRRSAAFRHHFGVLRHRLLAIADEPTDDDDVRLRKRVAVSAGYLLVVLPLQLPFLGQGHPLGWLMAATMPVISV